MKLPTVFGVFFYKYFFKLNLAQSLTRTLRHLVKSQLVKHLGLRSIAPIPSPNLAPLPQIDGNITGSDILTDCCYRYVLAK